MTRPSTSKKGIPTRDAASGKFEQADPLADPALMDFALKTVRAIQHLEPVLAGVAAAPHDADDHDLSKLCAIAGLCLSAIKDAMLEQLAADPESLAETKKRRIEARRLGNMPLAEVQAIQQKAQAWMALPDVATNLLQSKPVTPAIGDQQ